MKTQIFCTSLMTVLLMASCDKKEVEVKNPAVATQAQPDEKSVSLQQFGESRVKKNERDFFANTGITDNTAYFQANLAKEASTSAKPRIRLRWHDDGPHCETFPGLCVIIPIGIAVAPDDDYELLAVDLAMVRGKLSITFPTDQDIPSYGLTSEGYLPIDYDFFIPRRVSESLGLTGDHYIASGIYKANYDRDLKRYTGIVVDIK